MRSARLTTLVSLTLMVAAGCNKPKPGAESRAFPDPPPAPAAQRVVKSPGGVELPALDPRVEDLVMKLPRQRSWALGQLLGAGDLAEPAMLALLRSKNLDELEVALTWFTKTGRAIGADGIVQVLEHPAVSIRQQALEALVAVGGKEYAPEVSRRTDDADPTVRARAIEALTRLDADEARRVLVPKLEDPDEEVAIEAALALGRVPSEGLAPDLARLAANDHPVTATAALLAARLVGTPLPEAPILAALTGTDLRLAQAAARAIVVAPEASRPALWARASASPRAEVRRTALEARVTSEPAAALQLLEAAAKDVDPGVRASAANLLGLFGPEGQRATLVSALLADPDPRVRRAAIARLGQVDEPAAVDSLVSRLPVETDTAVLSLVPRSLAIRKDERAVEPLIALLEAEKVTAETSLALASLTGQRYGQDGAPWRAWYAAKAAPKAPAEAPAAP